MLSCNTFLFNICTGAVIFTFASVDIFCYFKIYVTTKKIEKEIANQAKLSSRDEDKRPKFESKVAHCNNCDNDQCIRLL